MQYSSIFQIYLMSVGLDEVWVMQGVNLRLLVHDSIDCFGKMVWKMECIYLGF